MMLRHHSVRRRTLARILKEEKLLRPGEEKNIYFPLAAPDDRKSLGKRNKSGGKPDWLHPGKTPLCPHCGKEMTFYAQLDSVNDENAVEDGGMIYVFYCFSCGEVHALAQSY